ncbi:hypothetical protein ACFFWC_14880 [Plantactinospora siamensis]|uniref:Integral membrane protein n=1 Tax=Plantactinospora siamensis TaxID=555372 RepID=A0ABV6P0V7_9ACTN
MSGGGLERRYRRLLSSYPVAHRAAYGEEMLGVLMAGAAPGQRQPGLRESLDLVVSGLRARLRVPVRAAGSAPWREASAVFGYGAAVLLAAIPAYQLSPGIFARGLPGLSRTGLVLALVWTLVAGTAALGWRRAAAACAIVAAAGQGVAVARTYVGFPDDAVTSWWRLVVAITAAASLIALLPSATRPEAAPALLTRSRLAIAVAAAVPLVAVPLLTGAAIRAGFYLREGDPGVLAGDTVLLAALAIVTLRLRPSLRRRVLVLTAPAVATMLVVKQTFGGFLASSPRFDPPVYLVAPQWAGLVLTPLLVFVGGCWVLARYERRLASGALLG